MLRPTHRLRSFMQYTITALFTLCSSYGVLAAPTTSDYQQALDLRQNWSGLTRNIVFKAQWQPDNRHIRYSMTTDKGVTFYLENAFTGQRQPAFDQQRVANGLSRALHEDIAPNALPFTSFHYADDKQAITFELDYQPWYCSLKQDDCQPQTSHRQPRGFGVVRDLRYSADNTPHASPNGKWHAYIEAQQLVINDDKGHKRRLTEDGQPNAFYDPESIRWSPDSKKLVLYRVTPGTARYVTRVLSSPQDQLQPKVITQLYPKPGDNVDIEHPVLVDVASGQVTRIDHTLFANPYSLDDLQWQADSQRFSFVYTERGHQRMKWLAVDAQTGAVQTWVDESSDTFVFQWREFHHNVKQQGKELIWRSERSGWAHLYRYDGTTGKVRNAITHGPWVVRSVLRVDDQQRRIWFAASGMNKGEDPYFIHYYRVNFDGSGLTALTPERANHQLSLSPDGKYFIDNYSRVDQANAVTLHRASDGKLLRTVAQGDISRLLAAGFTAPQPFVAKGRDGKTDIWGLIVKPQRFDPTKRYPVIENIYAGPHDSFVPKSFWPFGYHSGGDKVIGMQALANLGFIVVQIDGMGTANRSKAFHDVAWKNLADSGFPDRIRWHRAAAKHFPWYDLSQGVGIYGASAGGQSALLALEQYPDFYRVAVAMAGCYDNRMDKISWNEQWLGWPVDESYRRSSAMLNAGKVQGDLLLIVGEQDSNVDPSSTLQVVDQLIRAGKDFDFIEVPGGEHSTGRSTGPIRYIQRRQFDFFVRHLLHQPTPAWNRLPR